MLEVVIVFAFCKYFVSLQMAPQKSLTDRTQNSELRIIYLTSTRTFHGITSIVCKASQCRRSVVQVLVVKVDIGVVTYEAMTSQCGSSVVQVLVVIVDIEVVIYKAMTPQCWRLSSSLHFVSILCLYRWHLKSL